MHEKAEAIRHYNEAQVAKRYSHFRLAVEELQKALEIDPTFADAWGSLGAAYGALNQPDKALSALATAITLGPSDLGFVHNQMAITLFAENRVDEARQHAIEATKLGFALHAEFLDMLGLGGLTQRNAQLSVRQCLLGAVFSLSAAVLLAAKLGEQPMADLKFVGVSFGFGFITLLISRRRNAQIGYFFALVGGAFLGFALHQNWLKW